MLNPRVTILLIFSCSAYAKVDFLKDVQPVLTSKCMACHSGDAPQGGLKAHTREDLLKGGKSGPSIIPGKGAESLLVAKMEGKRGLRMPPSGPALAPEVIEQIRLWIDEGAKFDGAPATSERIARLAPRSPALPPGSASHPIDRFIDAYFAKQGLKPPKLVTDELFARRAWLDTSGLPPTPEQLREFENSKESDKRARVIDRLLTDRQAYAENWISFWNDLLRNDEGVVYQGERKSITKWLLGALESNTPYDAMVRSLLDPPAKTGSEGFLVGVTWRGVVSASQTPPMQAAQNAAQVFLGINMKCAACHDSFINRWKLRDTYGLASMFSETPLELVRCDIRLGTMSQPKFPFPELKVDFGESLESRRKAAADWFVHRENGRFARTIVNRYWKKLLGRGIVEPADDMDAEPWDEDLLDWLASDFAASGFDLQQLMRRIMTSRAYQFEAAEEKGAEKQYVFRGPRLRRLSAEQFQDAISAATGDWRVNSPRTETYATYTREWRLKSDPLSRVLGRPIRDQVYTERSSEATTLQALELTNGPLLSRRLERGSKALLGQLEPAPVNLFDSKVVRGGTVPVDIDITGARELWLLMEDVDSYDPPKVVGGWVNAELVGPAGPVKLESLQAQQPVATKELALKTSKAMALPAKMSSAMVWNIAGKGFKRFRAEAAIDEGSRQSAIGPAVRFFVFNEKPNPDQLVRVQGKPLYQPPRKQWTSSELTERLYAHLLSRKPTEEESSTVQQLLGRGQPAASGVEDLLWALLMSPEFQYIH
jgi:hypothetical protein